MGMTELLPGSVWNTMPAHGHSRRLAASLYVAGVLLSCPCRFSTIPA